MIINISLEEKICFGKKKNLKLIFSRTMGEVREDVYILQ